MIAAARPPWEHVAGEVVSIAAALAAIVVVVTGLIAIGEQLYWRARERRK